MLATMRLNEGWQLRHEELRVGPDMAARVQHKADGWMSGFPVTCMFR